jgi:uncharacterized membrane protein
MTRNVRIFLILSVVVNLFCLGIFTGYAFREMKPHASPLDQQLALAARLPDHERRQLEDALRDAWSDADKMHDEMLESKREAARLLTSEPFDMTAYQTQVQHMNDIHTKMKQRLSKAIVELARTFTPEQRTVLAEIVTLPPGPPPCGKDGPPKR